MHSKFSLPVLETFVLSVSKELHVKGTLEANFYLQVNS